jgi:O-antigen ligase
VSVASRSLFYGSCAVLAAALVLGGSGAAAPLHNLIIELAALGLLIVWFTGRSQGLPLRQGEAPTLLLLLLVVVTPVLQLVPLPYDVWTRLPGRELAAGIDAVLGFNEWRPLSLDPEATALAGAYLLLPAALLLCALRMGQEERRRVSILIVFGAAASLVLGVLQVAAAGTSFHLYTNSHNGFATGFFANRNHQADLLLIGMLFAAALLSQLRQVSPAIRWTLLFAAVIAFSAGVIATTSRMAFLLLPIAVLGSFSFFYPRGGQRKRMTLLLVSAAVLAIAGLIAMSANTHVVIRRFQSFTDGRFQFWSEAMYAVQLYFPLGSGLGTFDPVFRMIEDLNQLDAPYVNHAHNDYVQILLEVGAWGAFLVVLFLVLLGLRSVRKQPSDAARALARAAKLSILILLLHSIVDYPLRILSLLSLFGLFVAFLHPPLTAGTRPSAQGKSV